MRKKLKEVLTVESLVARNANEAMVAPMVQSGGVYFCRESGVRRSVCVDAFSTDLASVAMKVSSHLTYTL
jgi:hypothetical protein